MTNTSKTTVRDNGAAYQVETISCLLDQQNNGHTQCFDTHILVHTYISFMISSLSGCLVYISTGAYIPHVNSLFSKQHLQTNTSSDENPEHFMRFNEPFIHF